MSDKKACQAEKIRYKVFFLIYEKKKNILATGSAQPHIQITY